MKKFFDFLDKFEGKFLALLIGLMVAVIFLSTFLRFTKLAVIPWLEELARYLMIWIVLVGAGSAGKNNQHFTVDNFVKALPKSTHKPLFILRALLITVFSGIVVYLSLDLVGSIQAMGQLSPALRIPIWLIYLALPIGFILLAVHNLRFSYERLKEEQ